MSHGDRPEAGSPGGDGAAVPLALVEAARDGDAEALVDLVERVQDRVYRLALRMTACPADAEDATQEVLIRVITRLDGFRGDAAFTTWVHRVAVNHLLDRSSSAAERLELTFGRFEEDLLDGLADAPSDRPGADLLAREVQLGCTLALLTCLDRDHRVAYVLGEVFQVSSDEGAAICDVSPPAYRKRLSRARQRVRGHLERCCGLVSDAAPCRCDRRVEVAVAIGRVDAASPTLVGHPAAAADAEMEELADAAALLRAHPDYLAPGSVTDQIRRIIDGRAPALLGPSSDGSGRPSDQRPVPRPRR